MPTRRSPSIPSLSEPTGGPGLFHPAVQAWFAATFAGPTRAQRLAWPEILAGRSTLLSAPTGSGKTLAAFLAALERLLFTPPPPPAARCRVLYVSPLKALAVDVERNLQAPLTGIARQAARCGQPIHLPEIAIRSGDTPQTERQQMARHPPDILITTPESLFLLLTSRARALLASVEVVILDEVHVLVGSKRGAHLALSVERVAELAGREPQRIGLSATAHPLPLVAAYLGGSGPDGAPRPVAVVDAAERKAYRLTVEMPAEAERPDPAGPRPRSAWAAIQPRLLELIRTHTSTILFVNSRRLAERLAAALNQLAGEELCRAHHGSLAREERLRVEALLKAGRLPALVATSTLELGIDMGAVDLVIQIEAPPSVASGIQRVGRAGHQAGAVSSAVLFPKYRGDLLATAAVTGAILTGAVEPLSMPRNPLDLLAQHIVSAVAMDERGVDGLFALVRRAAPFASLPRAQFEGVLDLLSGRYPSDRFAALRPRLTWDRKSGRLRPRQGARALAVANAGTIPDRGLYGVYLAPEEASGLPPTRSGGRRVGELDEEMVFECREGDVFILGAASWRIAEIGRDRILVRPAPGAAGRMPFWRADRPPRPAETGRALGRLTRLLAELPRARALDRLVQAHALDPRAAESLLDYLAEQRAATGPLPDDRTILLERFRDELGDWRLCLLSPFGGRLHAPWTLAIQARLRQAGEPEVEAVWSDDGIVLRLPDRDRPPEAAELLPEPEAIEGLVASELAGSPLFAARFREAAARALLLPRRRPGQRTPLWMQRRRAAALLQAAAAYPDFPLLLEAYRECLQDVFDLPALVELAERVRRRELRLRTVDTPAPSPFAAALLFGYVGNYIYEGDAPLAERRAHALAVDPRRLRELLGEAELRELLDPAVLAEAERALQGLEAGRQAGSADRLHDLLLGLGDLGEAEIAARVASPTGAEPAAALARRLSRSLLAEGRAISVSLAGERRLIAAEEAGRYRDALGVALPPGLPAPFLEPVPDPLGELLARFARTHGPFPAALAARRYGIPEAAAQAALDRLTRSGRLVEGEFCPAGRGREWCDAEVLAALRRRSLARFRRQVEPAEPAALARLALDWHGVLPPSAPSAPRSAPSLVEILERLQGAALPASLLESEILPARLADYRPQMLDALLATGELVWRGLAPLGGHDGKLALYFAEDLPLLAPPPAPGPAGELPDRIREILGRRGASFFPDLLAEAGRVLPEQLLCTLWELVWAGEVTNDTLAPLRAYLRPARIVRRRSRLGLPGRGGWGLPPAGAGRFSLFPARPAPPPAERALALAEQLLARHGILTRDAVAAEGAAGGFAGLYPILSTLEQQGRIRRGYFVTGLGGSQFAEAAALERLRALREADPEGPAAMLLSAADPASPYGAALPWPAAGRRLARTPGSHVLLADGRLVAYLTPAEAELQLFLPEHEPDRSRLGRAAAAALAAWIGRTARLGLGWAQQEPSPLAPFLLAAGFSPAGQGFRLGGVERGPIAAPGQGKGEGGPAVPGRAENG